MGKDWDAPWKYSIVEHGFTDGGNRLPAPTFTSSRNPTCQNCGRRQRTWKGGSGKCECEAPEFDSEIEVSDRRKFQAWCVTWLQECFRVLRPGGMIKVFGATRMMHRMAAAMEEAGFILQPRHSLEGWSYGSGFPKSLNLGKAIEAKILLGGSGSLQLRLRNGHAPGRVGTNMGGHRSGTTHLADDPPAQGLQTEQGMQFGGFGTALKPAWEPFLVGLKA